MIFPFVVSLQKQPIKTKGFTLVELIVVIVILAIIAIYTSSKYMGASRFSAAAAQATSIDVGVLQVTLPSSWWIWYGDFTPTPRQRQPQRARSPHSR